MTESQKQTLLSLTRNAIRSRFDNSKVELPSDAEFQAKRGLFVTLNLDGPLMRSSKPKEGSLSP